MRLSVLDQSPISAGSTGRDALANSIDLARLADDLGYHRYWVAEHHGGPMLAGPAPEVLIGPLAAATRRIRVGSGGVMLPHYSPLKVAEAFSLLAGPLPGPDRPRARPRRGDRPDDDLRAPARPPPGLAGRLLRPARRAARLPRRRAARRPPVRAARAVAARPARGAGAVAARLLAAERDLGRPARAPLRVRRLHQPGRRGDRDRLPAPLRPRRPARRPAHRGRVLGARRRDRGGGLAADRLEPDGDVDAAPRAADRGPAGRAGAALPRVRGRAGDRRLAPDHGRHARPGPRGARDRRAAVRRRRGDRRDDHLRPRAPAGARTSCWPRRSASRPGCRSAA